MTMNGKATAVLESIFPGVDDVFLAEATWEGGTRERIVALSDLRQRSQAILNERGYDGDTNPDTGDEVRKDNRVVGRLVFRRN